MWITIKQEILPMFWFRIKQIVRFNQAAVMLVFLCMLIAGSVLAAPAGREVLGAPTSRVEGTDNTLLLTTNLAKFNANYRIEKIEADDIYYYVLYTYNDLVITNGVWQEMVIEKTRKITKDGLSTDLGLYLAGQLAEENESRIAELKLLQDQARISGPEKRVTVTEYSGLIGKALNVAGEFTGYEPIHKVEIPTPTTVIINQLSMSGATTTTPATDNIKIIYNEYIDEHPELGITPEPATSSMMVGHDDNGGVIIEASSTIVNF